MRIRLLTTPNNRWHPRALMHLKTYHHNECIADCVNQIPVWTWPQQCADTFSAIGALYIWESSLDVRTDIISIVVSRMKLSRLRAAHLVQPPPSCTASSGLTYQFDSWCKCTYSIIYTFWATRPCACTSLGLIVSICSTPEHTFLTPSGTFGELLSVAVTCYARFCSCASVPFQPCWRLLKWTEQTIVMHHWFTTMHEHAHMAQKWP